jgi:hypothetical protein
MQFEQRLRAMETTLCLPDGFFEAPATAFAVLLAFLQLLIAP